MEREQISGCLRGEGRAMLSGQEERFEDDTYVITVVVVSWAYICQNLINLHTLSM